MNLDDAAKQSLIDLSDDEKQSIEDDLDDVIDMLNELKAFEPGERSRTTKGSLRDDEPVPQDVQPTSDHADGDTIKSPDP